MHLSQHQQRDSYSHSLLQNIHPTFHLNEEEIYSLKTKTIVGIILYVQINKTADNIILLGYEHQLLLLMLLVDNSETNPVSVT